MAEILTAYQCLNNHQFQDWLANAEIMKRVPVLPGDLETLPRKEQKSTYTRERFLEILEDNAGYIVPPQIICNRLYGYVDESRLRNVAVWGNQTEYSLRNPDNLFHATKMGWAVGISGIRLGHVNLPIIYCLWQRLWDFVEIDEIAKRIYGAVDPDARSAIILHMYKLRSKYLIDTKVRIDHKGSLGIQAVQAGEVSFQLYEAGEDEGKIPEAEEYLPPYLRFNFQDWLARQDMGLLVRERRPNLMLNYGQTLTPKETQLLSTLERYQGNIIPNEYLSVILYGQMDESIKIREHVRGVREKLRESGSIYRSLRLGLAVGVRELKIAKSPLSVLYRLWRRQEQGVTLRDLSNQVFGMYDDEHYGYITRVIYELRGLLSDTGYDISTNYVHRRGESRYSLKK